MQDPDFIALFVAPLVAAGIDYIVTGSVASSIYGEPRTTLDIDLVVFLEASRIQDLPSIFPEEDYYLPPVDIIAVEARRESRGHFNIIHHATGLKADCYLSRNHPALPWARKNARKIQTPACEINVAPPEYVILHKLEFFRESGHQRHLRDIAGMIAQQELDLGFLTPSLSQLGLQSQWQQALDLVNR